VSDEVIDKVLEAGSWAAHACNLQSIRYIVVREENTPGLVPGNIAGAPVHILILQDERVYEANTIMPIRNRLLDAGAAAQNIVLAAHAYGLGGVWLTHSDDMLEKLYDYFKLHERVKIVTYVDVGYPAQTPAPVDKLGLDETLLRRI
jgi:nitroreductase